MKRTPTNFTRACTAWSRNRWPKRRCFSFPARRKRHKEFLLAYLKGEKKFTALSLDTVIDYGIAQYVSMPDIQKNMKSVEIYLVAAHRELNSYNFYQGLAAIQPEGEVKQMLRQMANQELKHKEKVEYLYSNTAFPQTAGG